MLEKCLLISSEISDLEVLNMAGVAGVIESMDSLTSTRILVTDNVSSIIFDTHSNRDTIQYALFPEIVTALDGYDVFSWNYHNGITVSRAAVPIATNGSLTGCVYMMEYDTQQGNVIKALQYNIFTITIVLELVIILISFIFSHVFTKRLRKILASIRIIREGDYSHKIKMAGNDELVYLSDEFNDLSEKLHESEQMRRAFVSDASHELKTPLASIKLLSDSILQNDMDTETIHEFVRDIGNEAERLNRMSQKLLSLSKVDSQIDSDCEIVLLTPTIQQVVRMLSSIADKNQITLEVELEQDGPILVLEDDLYQIIFNLAENGIKYNTPGGTLRISLNRNDELVILKITDNGVGIPQDSLEHIFDRFYRVDKARARKTGGSGLGLSIVKNLVERNQGTIKVDSILGKGSVFTITFPIFDTEVDDL